jgi:hypothetical protein
MLSSEQRTRKRFRTTLAADSLVLPTSAGKMCAVRGEGACSVVCVRTCVRARMRACMCEGVHVNVLPSAGCTLAHSLDTWIASFSRRWFLFVHFDELEPCCILLFDGGDPPARSEPRMTLSHATTPAFTRTRYDYIVKYHEYYLCPRSTKNEAYVIPGQNHHVPA